MALRKCSNHGWIDTSEYEPRSGDAELVCKTCRTPVTGFKTDYKV